jgi:ABC-type transport system involved in multi-copper enzyme maturation permease subunit
MTLRIYSDMVRAELLKLRRRRSIIATAMFLSLGVIVLYFVVLELEHLRTPSQYGPAGGVQNFDHALVLLSIFFGSLMAILVGTEAGTADTASGVFRDLVVTGRPRGWLFAARVPAALIVTLAIGLTSIAVAIAAAVGFAGSGGTPIAAPSLSFVLDGVLWVALAESVMCLIALGIGSLTGSRATTLTLLIGWQVIASRLLPRVTAFGNARDLIPNLALGALKPGLPLPDNAGLTMNAGLAIVILLGWIAVCIGAGAWRTQSADA